MMIYIYTIPLLSYCIVLAFLNLVTGIGHSISTQQTSWADFHSRYQGNRTSFQIINFIPNL